MFAYTYTGLHPWLHYQRTRYFQTQLLIFFTDDDEESFMSIQVLEEFQLPVNLTLSMQGNECDFHFQNHLK